MRARARASATREVSMVIQRRPHCSATYALVPEPQVLELVLKLLHCQR